MTVNEDMSLICAPIQYLVIMWLMTKVHHQLFLCIFFYLLPASVNHPGKAVLSLAAAQQQELLDHHASPFVRPVQINTPLTDAF